MTNINYDYIENYLRDIIEVEDEKLLEMEKYAEANHVPIIERETEEFIKFLISITKPKKILELGTAIGYSSISFAKFSKNIKRIDSVEIRSDMVEIANKNIEESHLSDIIYVYESDAYEFLEDLEDKYDMIFIDAAKGQYEKYFNSALKNLNDKGIIICDNVLFKGMVAEDDLIIRRKKTIVKRLRTFLSDVSKDDRFISSIIPIGDGVLLVRRKDEED
ncbi:O-methyltransferase [Peptoniphilus sp. MSJ-1]|uniref:tRNA 5-hydroxyuridine methyltransferase n=1 Tax=Peptoniphilus ovalis TaxID=2841503 RepID=A0ABS6FLJ8_9FIRM|nr:O-methyltransferase [Peptoniphilus ovalis]MBU5670111.1 O-methyltransferase [Peptoniphilus ovalis]